MLEGTAETSERRGREASIPLRIGYMCNRYPAISHSFVLGEVLALRSLGAEVTTVSIRRAHAGELLSGADRSEYASTYAALPTRPSLVARVHAGAFARQPLQYLRTLGYALRLGLGSARGPLWQLFYFAEAVLLWARLRREGLTHVHGHFTSPTADVAMLVAHFGRDGGKPWTFSFTAHGTDIFVADQRLLAEKVRQAKFVVCVSDFGRSQLMGLVDEAHWPKIRVVRCGIDLDRFDSAPAPQAAGGPVRLLSVGRLHPVKGHAVLLEALALLGDAGVAVELTIVGDGEMRAGLERRAAELGVAGAVTFAGNVGQDAIARHYREADVFCLPSFGEGIPVVLMEAMASRLPVVASRVMGIPELVEEDVNGLLVRPARADELAAAIRRLVDDPRLRQAMGENGRARVAEEHSLDRNAEQLHRLLREELRRTADGVSLPAVG